MYNKNVFFSHSWWKYYVLDTIGDDWLFCLLLGISMALISFAMDFCILKLQVTLIYYSSTQLCSMHLYVQ